MPVASGNDVTRVIGSNNRYVLHISDMLRIMIIIIFGSLHLLSEAQSCIPDYIHFYLQSQVDSFQINYPGCTVIDGDVIISGADILNLNGLSVVTSIGDDLRIENTSSLITLYGLNNLSSIGGGLTIEDNETLLNLVGLNSLVSIGGSVRIMENTGLLHLIGLNNLISVGGDFNIGCSGYYWTGNPLLNNLSGLNSLSSIGGSLSICLNHGLTDLSGIENLTNVENVRISSNDNLTSLAGLQGLANVNGYVSIGRSDSLISLDGLNNLTTVGSLSIFRLPGLYDLGGLERLCTVVNDLTISYNYSMNSITSLDSLTYIGGKLTIKDNYNLNDLSGLEHLTAIGEGIEISGNSSLLSLAALSSITIIGGDLIIKSNSNLTSLAGLSGMTAINGNLVVSSSSNLTSLSGIENINYSSIQNLEISWLISLTDCSFPNICEYLTNPNGLVDIYRNGYPCNNPGQIANDCGITLPCLPFGNYHFIYQYEVDSFQTYYPGCTDLKGSLFLHGGWGGGTGDYNNLNGLGVVTSIEGMLEIHGAYSLSSLTGIDNINGASITDLYITNCPYLSECEVQSICNYLAAPNGETEISENAFGCNSPEQVEAKCDAVTIHEHFAEPLFKIFPNPAYNYLIVYNQNRCEIDKILIYNIIGQIINYQDFDGPLIDISELDQGIYILEIITDNLIHRMKFVVEK